MPSPHSSRPRCLAPRLLSLTAVSLAVLLAGCTDQAPSAATSPTPRPALELVAFDSCAQLEKDLRAAAQKAQADGLVVPGYQRGPAANADTARAASESAAGAPPASSTNVHEAGVDEPDIVKTDGRRIVTVAGGVLRVVDPATRAQTGRLDLGIEAFGEPELLLAGDHALVLADGGPVRPMRDDTRIMRPANGRSEVLLVDLSSGSPRLLSRYRGDGRVVDARQRGGVARVVVSSSPKIQFPYRGDPVPENVVQDDRDTIQSATIDAWLPSWEITTGGTTARGRLDCSDVSRPEAFSGLTMLRVLTFDVNAAALGNGDPVALVADGDAVYGTNDSLYIANNQGRLTGDTAIYRFALPPVGKPVHAASGKVPGVLLNQYSMSEWDGHLRVATTDASATSSSSAVRVLREQSGKLVQVGAVEGLGKGERIFSVRFLGPRGYVVTFRQTDPLYSLDLADPTEPRVTGELKITGYSAHLQPVGENRLVGIGQEADTQGRTTGLQVSLFDVTDPAAPKRLDRHVVASGQSEAEADPHAVLWWPATNLLVLPVADARDDGALALRVTGDRLQPVTRLAAETADAGPMRRAVVVGDTLWSVTDQGLLASNASTLARIGWVDLN
ncbi:beta-propeller domain-containing protein [Actinoplanes sp. URMC 104]|uniref:beta-propeller domain-containing protein n=1 Tax=Actinoplanes sp. URMC 104 TaxID=3423409 RepID=UPI003F1DA81E